VSDVAHLFPRCPRCGYGLRMVRGYWWCDVCRASLPTPRSPSLRESFRLVGESLRRSLGATPRRRVTLVYPASVSSVPERRAPLARCPECGALTPSDGAACVHCGTAFGPGVEAPAPRAARAPRVLQRDEIVYRYVVEHMGEISLAKASAELHMTSSELQASIRRLEGSGKLSRDVSREG